MENIIKNHISLESGVRSYFLNHNAYCCWVMYGVLLGREDGVFSLPYLEANKLLEKCDGSITKLVTALGLTPNDVADYTKGPIHRVDILQPEAHNLRVATGYESSANCYFNTRFSDENKPEIFFLNKKSGITVLVLEDEGIVHNIVEVSYDKTGKGSVLHNGVWFEVVDDFNTNPADLTRLNGKYVTTSGKIHLPNPKNYDGRTSGGLSEAVTDPLPNRKDEVLHSTICGGYIDGEDKVPFTVIRNVTAYSNPVGTYQDIIVEIDKTVPDHNTKTQIIRDIVEASFENIAFERKWLEAEDCA